MNIVVNLNKPPGMTSFEAVAAVKRRFKVRKAGHAGTLDPLATGVLVVCLNEATKIAGLLSRFEKEYVFTARLGEATDTYDAEGSVIRTVEDVSVTTDEIRSVLERFTGEIEQVPPMYSAIKREGRPLYELARKGIEVERAPRKVTISSLDLVAHSGTSLTLRAVCTSGTYIRSLCNDIGEALGVGAHVAELERTRVGAFGIDRSALLDELPLKQESLWTIDDALGSLPEIRLSGSDLRRAKNGNPIKPLPPGLFVMGIRGGVQFKGQRVRLKDREGRLFGIARAGEDELRIERLFNM